MSNRFDDLIGVLEKELEFHGLLIQAAFSMNAAIKIRSMDEVRKASRTYDECTCRIQDLEEKRLQWSDEICGYSGKTVGHASLSRVMEHAPAECRQRLAALRASLKEAVGNLSKINYSNQVLLCESLKTIANLFKYIALHDPRNQGGYKKLGTMDRGRVATAIVNTVA
jgi:hypothetical protein